MQREVDGMAEGRKRRGRAGGERRAGLEESTRGASRDHTVARTAAVLSTSRVLTTTTVLRRRDKDNRRVDSIAPNMAAMIND